MNRYTYYVLCEWQMFDGTYVYVPTTCIMSLLLGRACVHILIQREIGISGVYII